MTGSVLEVQLSDSGDGSAVFVNGDKSPVVIAKAAAAPSIFEQSLPSTDGSAIFVDGMKKTPSIKRTRIVGFLFVPPSLPANVFSNLILHRCRYSC